MILTLETTYHICICNLLPGDSITLYNGTCDDLTQIALFTTNGDHTFEHGGGTLYLKATLLTSTNATFKIAETADCGCGGPSLTCEASVMMVEGVTYGPFSLSDGQRHYWDIPSGNAGCIYVEEIAGTGDRGANLRERVPECNGEGFGGTADGTIPIPNDELDWQVVAIAGAEFSGTYTYTIRWESESCP